MKVSKTEWNSWKVKAKHGTIAEIAKATGLHRNTIAAAYKYGEMTKDIYNAIHKYHETIKH